MTLHDSRKAALEGTNLLVLTTPREGDIKSALTTILKRSTVDGLIIGSELLDKQSLGALVNQKVPFVLLGQDPGFRHYSIDINSVQGTQTMISHMVDQGYKKIGAVFGPEVYPYVQERYTSYLSTLKAAGIDWNASFFAGYFDHPSVVSRLNDLLDQHPDMDCLFVSAGGEFIFDALKVLRARRLEIPKFGVGVFDDYPFLDHITPGISAIRQPLSIVGTSCVAMLMDLIRGIVPDPEVKVLPTTLVKRGSLGD